MKRLILAACAALALPVLLAGCTGTAEEKATKREQAVLLAADRIERFNAMGVDPVQLEPVYLLALDTACVVVLTFGVEAGLETDTLQNLSAACDVIQKAAAPAPAAPEAAPGVAPVPAPKPAPT